MQAVSKLGLPSNYQDAGFTHKFWTPSQMNADPTAIMFMLNTRDPRFPITYEGKPLSFEDFIGWVNVGDDVTTLSHILDMDARALVPRDDVIQAIGKGADLGLLDGVPLAQALSAKAQPPTPQQAKTPFGKQQSSAPSISELVTLAPDLTKFTVDQLRDIAIRNRLGDPKKKSGKSGVFIKQDWIELINEEIVAASTMPKLQQP
jgi:hypothetical protein